jgi:hypothetical protein
MFSLSRVFAIVADNAFFRSFTPRLGEAGAASRQKAAWMMTLHLPTILQATTRLPCPPPLSLRTFARLSSLSPAIHPELFRRAVEGRSACSCEAILPFPTQFFAREINSKSFHVCVLFLTLPQIIFIDPANPPAPPAEQRLCS